MLVPAILGNCFSVAEYFYKKRQSSQYFKMCWRKMAPMFNPLNAELNPIRHLLALVGARHIVHVSRTRVNIFFVMDDCDYCRFSFWFSFSLYVYGGQNVSTDEKYKKYSGRRQKLFVCKYRNAVFAAFHKILYWRWFSFMLAVLWMHVMSTEPLGMPCIVLLDLHSSTYPIKQKLPVLKENQYSVYLVFPAGKAAAAWRWSPTPI